MGIFRRLNEGIFWARLIALLLLVFFLTTFVLFFFEGHRDGWELGARQCGDLFQHYAAGRFWSEGQVEALYRDFRLGTWINDYRAAMGSGDESSRLENFNYVYAPLVAWVSAAGIHVSFSTWITFSLVFNVIAYLGAFLFLKKSLGLGLGAHAELPLLYYLGFSSFYYALIPGQNTVLSLFLVASAGWLLVKHQPLLAGLVISCICYKPQFIPFIGLTAVLCGQWRFAIATGVGCLVWLGAGILLCGLESYRMWLESLADMGSGIQFQRDGLNQSWRGLLLSLAGGDRSWIRAVTLLLPVAGCALIALAWHRRLGLLASGHPALPLYAAMSLFLISSPYIGHYDLLMGLPLWLYALDRHPLNPTQIVILVLFALTSLLSVSGMFSGLSLSAIPLTLCFLAYTFGREWNLSPPPHR